MIMNLHDKKIAKLEQKIQEIQSATKIKKKISHLKDKKTIKQFIQLKII